MPIWLVGAGVLALAALAAIFFWPRAESPLAATSPGGAGKLVASQPVIDLGQVPFDKMVEARYELANTGQGTLRIVGKPVVKTIEGC